MRSLPIFRPQLGTITFVPFARLGAVPSLRHNEKTRPGGPGRVGGFLARLRHRMTNADGRWQSSLPEPCGAMTDGYRPKRYGLK